MPLRPNPKRKIIQDAGEVRNSKKYHMSKLNRANYSKRVERESAIDANMIKLLKVAKSRKPEDHLNFWKDNLKSDYPVVEIRKSNLVHGGYGVFVTNNCIFLPSNLLYIPNSELEPQNQPAVEGTEMYMYQFALSTGRKTSYLFPTLERDGSLPCAQFINTPLRKTQGHYSDGVVDQCRQAMHIGNVSLLGKFPGGYIRHTLIYPGFEIIGPYTSSYRLPIAQDYHENRSTYEERWQLETQIAYNREQAWLREIKHMNKEKIEHWQRLGREMSREIIKEVIILTVEDFKDDDDDEDY